jgi:type IV pilus assembly protein PilV
LLEVLVAMVVLSIGLLGVAALQLNAMRYVQGALFMSQASILAQGFADRMRQNPGQAAAGSYVISSPVTTAPATDCEATTCTPAQLAAFDRYNWYTQVTNLPSGAATVSCSGTCSSTVTHVITVSWNEPIEGTRSISVSLRL